MTEITYDGQPVQSVSFSPLDGPGGEFTLVVFHMKDGTRAERGYWRSET